MGGTDGFSGEHPSSGGRGYGRGFSLFMGQPSHISPQESHRSWIIQQTSLKILLDQTWNMLEMRKSPYWKNIIMARTKVLQWSGPIDPYISHIWFQGFPYLYKWPMFKGTSRQEKSKKLEWGSPIWYECVTTPIFQVWETVFLGRAREVSSPRQMTNWARYTDGSTVTSWWALIKPSPLHF